MTWKTSPRWRTALVVLLAISASAAAVGQLGYDTEVSQIDPLTGWSQMHFAKPLVGDAAAYEIVLMRGATQTPQPGASFSLTATVKLPGPDGIQREYIQINTTGSFGLQGLAGAWRGVETDFEFLDGHGRVAGRFLEGTSNQGQDGCDFSCPPGETSYKREIRHYAPDYFGRTPCGIMTALQGQAINPAHWNASILPTCKQQIGQPMQAIALADDNQTAIFASSGSQLWVSPDIPYPVRFVENLGENRTLVSTLIRFTRGSSPLPTERPHALPLEDATTLGPSEKGISHPYPLSQAFVDAQTDEPVATWLQAHNAYLRSATHSFDETSEVNTTTWAMAWSDGQDSIDIEVVHEARTGGIPVDPQDLALLSERVTIHSQTRDALGDPHPNQVPTQLPTVETLWNRWAAAGGQGSPNSWAYSVYCVDDCNATRVFVSAGLAHRFDRTERYPVTLCLNCTSGATGNVRDSYAVVLDGSRVVYAEIGQSVRARQAIGAAPQTSPPIFIAHAAGTPSLVTIVEKTWDWPPARVVSSVAGVAALLAILHHWFPGLIGLFSRISPVAALNQENRAYLYNLIGEEPGLHVREIARRTGIPRGTVDHHLRKLEHTGHVRRTGYARRATFALASTGHQVASLAPLLHQKTSRSLLGAIGERGASNMSSLAQAVGISTSTCHYHLAKLESAGLVIRSHGRGKQSAIHLTEVGTRLLHG